MELHKIIAFGFIVFISLIMVLPNLAPKKWRHDQLGQGFSNGLSEKDEYGFQDTYSCMFCDKKITQDSAFNWFHLSS